MIDKWFCRECQFVGMEQEFDKVKDPRGDETWTICPKCRAPDRVTSACDEPGCNEEGACGFPTDAGYRRTCFAHSIFKTKLAAFAPKFA